MQLKYYVHLILITLFSCTSLHSQNYQGTVVDDENVGISFAHVFFKNDQSRGSATNDIGEFSLLVSGSNKLDTLVISVLGYKTKFIPFEKIDKYNNIIKLSSSALKLDEVTIISDTYFRYILKEAIAKIPENYPTEKHLQRAYYQNYTISDTSYSEMIEADFQVISDGYQNEKVKEELYLNELRKTEDNRNLPKRLKHDNNIMFFTLSRNSVQRRSLSFFGGFGKFKTLESFTNQVDSINTLQLHSQNIQEGDTILTIKISDPSLGATYLGSLLYTLVSINLTDKAIVKVVFGDPWADQQDFEEVVYRKIKDRYYPAYIRRVNEFEYDQKTKKHYSSYSILFYDLVLGKQNINAAKKGKKMKLEKGLRQIKMKNNNFFWEEYPYCNQLSATTILRTKLNKYKKK